jgi:hypothetical protein
MFKNIYLKYLPFKYMSSTVNFLGNNKEINKEKLIYKENKNCKIFITLKQTSIINKKYNNFKNPIIKKKKESINEAALKKKNNIDAINTTFNTIIQEIHNKINSKITTNIEQAVNQISSSLSNYNNNAIIIINKSQNKLWEYINNYIEKVTPILNKFNNNKDIIDLIKQIENITNLDDVINFESDTDVSIDQIKEEKKINEMLDSISKIENLVDLLSINVKNDNNFEVKFKEDINIIIENINNFFKKKKIHRLNIMTLKDRFSSLIKSGSIEALLDKLTSAMKKSIDEYKEKEIDIFSKKRNKIIKAIEQLQLVMNELNDELNHRLKENDENMSFNLSNILNIKNDSIKNALNKSKSFIKEELNIVKKEIYLAKSKQQVNIKGEELLFKNIEKNAIIVEKNQLNKFIINFNDSKIEATIYYKTIKSNGMSKYISVYITKIDNTNIYYKYIDPYNNKLVYNYNLITNVCKLKK